MYLVMWHLFNMFHLLDNFILKDYRIKMMDLFLKTFQS